MRSICADILTAIYLETFYNKNDSKQTALKNELEIISSEYLKFVKQTLEEDYELLKLSNIPNIKSLESRIDWFNSLSEDLIDEKGNVKSKKVIRESKSSTFKKELDNTGNFLTENQKFKHLKKNGYANFGFVFIAFKYYSQFQHFNPMSKKLIEAKPFTDTYYMALTIYYMLRTIGIILVRIKIPKNEYSDNLDRILNEINKQFA